MKTTFQQDMENRGGEPPVTIEPDAVMKALVKWAESLPGGATEISIMRSNWQDPYWYRGEFVAYEQIEFMGTTEVGGKGFWYFDETLGKAREKLIDELESTPDRLTNAILEAGKRLPAYTLDLTPFL